MGFFPLSVKWHLGSLYNDSEKFGGISSSPVTHGFDDFNSTLMVAPTATTNCKCNPEWYDQCLFGHYNPKASEANCWEGKNGTDPETGLPVPPNPGCSRSPNSCCYNYWWRDDGIIGPTPGGNPSGHGISNLSNPVPADDASYLAVRRATKP
eukprot:COSAG04_NODE_5302_length_1666_cov_3.414167_2_plen_152_part_00